MTYEVTPEHFGFTIRLKLLLAASSLGFFVLPMFIFSLIGTSLAWDLREIVPSLVTWLVLAFWWYGQHSYSLDVDDDSARVGARMVRKGYVRYLLEIDSWPVRGGPQLVFSAHASAWARLFGGVIVVPKGLPEYQQIKQEISTWIVDSAGHDAT
jgi:hypothetical protein